LSSEFAPRINMLQTSGIVISRLARTMRLAG
jgi:hypothetical protein